jgi:hypothetical protein
MWRRLALLAVLAATATASGDSADGVPRGVVAFFDGGGCPPGWMPAADLPGRLVLAVTSDVYAGVKVGTPLADREDRTHAHTFAGTVNLPSKNIAGAAGGNHSAAAAGDLAWSVEAPASSGLPFIQLVACEKP